MTFEMYMKEREMEIAKRSREEGREEERESIAMTMLNVGEPLEKIRKFTKLSLERIKALAGIKDDD